MNVPKNSLLLLSGIPAAGKSSFGRCLAREYAFAHYDLECHPHGWPHPKLKPVWDSSRVNFVAQLKVLHRRVVLDWGFPPHAVSLVHELLAMGARLVWLCGGHRISTKALSRAGGIPVANSDAQIRAIQNAGYPNTLRCVTVEGLTDAGTIKDPSEIFREVFGA